MKQVSRDKLETLFAAGVNLLSDEQAAFLDRECADDSDLRAELIARFMAAQQFTLARPSGSGPTRPDEWDESHRPDNPNERIVSRTTKLARSRLDPRRGCGAFVCQCTEFLDARFRSGSDPSYVGYGT